MRTRLLTLALLLWATTAQAQFSGSAPIAQDYEECPTGSPTSCTIGTALDANTGDLIVVGWGIRGGQTLTSVTDATNGAYTCPAGANIQIGGAFSAGICYFIASADANVTPVMTPSAAATGLYMNATVWRPTATVTLDATGEDGSSSARTTHLLTAGISTGANAHLVITSVMMGGNSGAVTPGAGYTSLTNGGARWIGEYDATSVSSGSFNGTIDTSNSLADAIVVVSFNDSGGGGGTCTGGLTLMGAGKC